MKVKSLLSNPSYFKFGHRGATLFPNEVTQVFTPDPWNEFAAEEKAFEDALRYEKLGLIEIVEGTTSVKTDSTSPRPAFATITLASNPDDGNTVTVVSDGKTYVLEFDNNSTVTSGAFAVSIESTVDATVAKLIEVINSTAQLPLVAEAAPIGNTVVVYAKVKGPVGNTATIAKVGSGITVSSGFTGGSNGGVYEVDYIPHTVTTGTGAFVLGTGFTRIDGVNFFVTSSAGVVKYPTIAFTVSGGTINVTAGTGLANDDVIVFAVRGSR